MTAVALAILALLMGTGCVELPRGFEPVELERARELLAKGEVAVVDALAVGVPDPGRLPGGIRWRVAADASIGKLDGTPEVPSGPVLVVSPTAEVAHRSAASLAREGNHTVYVFIPGSAEERSRLRGALLARFHDDSGQEARRGEGS